MTISIIAAVAAHGAIGRRGDLLYHISADLKRFKALTMGCPVIMGRKTFESFPKGPLPGRRNIIVTRNRGYFHEGAETAPSLEDAISSCQDAEKVFIIGGGEIYRRAIEIADILEITEILAEIADADTFFPTVNPAEWETAETSEKMTDPCSGVEYRFLTLKRKNI